jgi:hypothetical protein
MSLRDVRLLLLLLLSAVLLVACKEHADPARTTAITCERVYRVCPGISPATKDEAAQCADIFQGRCGAEMRQHIQCVTGKCDDAGAVDRIEVERVCFSTIASYRECDESDGGVRGPDEGQLPPLDAGVTE